MRLDPTGKVSLNQIYTQTDPRLFFGTLRELEYRIPQLAKPYFLDLISEYRETQQVPTPQVLDIGCSYGINAALLRCDLTMDELYDWYGEDADTRTMLLNRDRDLVRSRSDPKQAYFVGLDVAQPALAYALAAGFVDAAVHADLESNAPTPRQRAELAGTDIVISTGCIGYVTERTIMHVVEANADRLPWMAHFVLRMFPFDPIADRLAALGYETVRVDNVFRQRRFATPEEQAGVLETMSAAGVDPRGLEDDGWLYAQLYISRPTDK